MRTVKDLLSAFKGTQRRVLVAVAEVKTTIPVSRDDSLLKLRRRSSC